MMVYIFFIIGLIFLIKGAEFLVDGASSIARRLNITDLVIGLTVVAFGTSTPELFVNIIASSKGNTDIAIGNVVGSNIANVFLILGVSSIIYPLAVTKGTVWKEIPFNLLAAIVLFVVANDQQFPFIVLLIYLSQYIEKILNILQHVVVNYGNFILRMCFYGEKRITNKSINQGTLFSTVCMPARQAAVFFYFGIFLE